MQKNNMLLTKNYHECIEGIAGQLESKGISTKDILNTELLIEEFYVRIREHDPAAEIKLKLGKTAHRDVYVHMIFDGELYDPTVREGEWDEADEEFYRTILLRSRKDQVEYSHTGKRNEVFIFVQSPITKGMRYCSYALLLGCLCSLLLPQLLPAGAFEWVRSAVTQPFIYLYSTAMNAFVGFMMFFAYFRIVNDGNKTEEKNPLNRWLACINTFVGIGILLLSMAMGMAVFGGDAPASAVTAGTEGDIKDFMTAGLVTALLLYYLGRFFKPVQRFTNFLLELIRLVFYGVYALLPLAVFASTFLVFSYMGAEVVPYALRMFVMMGAGLVLLVLLASCIAAPLCHVPFEKVLRGYAAFVRELFPLSYTRTGMSATAKFCVRVLGLSPRLSALAAAKSAGSACGGRALQYTAMGMFMIFVSGIPITQELLMDLFLLSIMQMYFMNSLAGCSVMLCCICQQFHIPPEVFGLVMAFIVFANKAEILGDSISATISAALASKLRMKKLDAETKKEKRI